MGKVELYMTDVHYEWFRCTDEGRTEAIASVPPVKRGRKRYLAFLSARDCKQDLTFHQFITAKAVRP